MQVADGGSALHYPFRAFRYAEWRKVRRDPWLSFLSNPSAGRFICCTSSIGSG
jgi:hypothetical protein